MNTPLEVATATVAASSGCTASARGSPCSPAARAAFQQDRRSACSAGPASACASWARGSRRKWRWCASSSRARESPSRLPGQLVPGLAAVAAADQAERVDEPRARCRVAAAIEMLRCGRESHVVVLRSGRLRPLAFLVHRDAVMAGIISRLPSALYESPCTCISVTEFCACAVVPAASMMATPYVQICIFISIFTNHLPMRDCGRPTCTICSSGR